MNMPDQGTLHSSLASLAMLSLHLQEGRDYLDYLHGFVIEALRRLEGQAIDAASVQKTVESEFGLNIPLATFAIYLKRLVKAGVIAPHGTGLIYSVTRLPDTSVAVDRQAARTTIAEVTSELAAFAHTRYSLQWDDEISSAALAAFLRRYSIDFLRFAGSKSPLPESALNKQNTAYVVAAFVATSAQDRPGLFESIKVLVQSHILANALLCPDLEKATRGFRDIRFLADTRFLIKALDLESQYDTQNARILLSAIRNLKGIVHIFPETKDELRTVLKAIIRGMQQGVGRGPVYRELMKRGRGVADVILAESALDNSLKTLGITVLRSPTYDVDNYQFQIDESELRDEIHNEVEYLSHRAVDHDIRVVRHIYALRKGRHCSSIEDCGYVLLTTNAALSRAAFNYERKNSTGWIFSAAVTDYHLSHLAWLKSPVEANELPRTEILANCYATMMPNTAMWNKYIDEVDRLKAEHKVSAKDHEVLRMSLNAPDELMDVTRGDVEGITGTNIRIILEKLERQFAAEKEEKLAQSQQAHEKTKREFEEMALLAQKRAAELAGAAEREEVLFKEKTEQAEQLRQLKEGESRVQQREVARRARVDRIANQIATCVFVIAGIVLCVFGAVSLLSNSHIAFGIPFVIVGILNLGFGFSALSVKRWARDWISRLMAKLIE